MRLTFYNISRSVIINGRIYIVEKTFPVMYNVLRSSANITSRFSESAGRNGLPFQKLIREVIFAPVLSAMAKHCGCHGG